MINSLYEKVKKFIQEYYLTFLFCLVFYVSLTYPIPYYIYTGGGTINTNGKIQIEEAYDAKGSFYMCYVEQLYATVPTYFLAQIFPSWDIVSQEDITLNEKESEEDVYQRDKISLKEANQNAIMVAYQEVGKKITVKDTHHYLIYLDENSNTDLKLGDDLVFIDHQEVTGIETIQEFLKEKKVGEKVSITVRDGNQTKEKYAVVIEKDGKKMFGISLTTIYDYETEPPISFSFASSESGPSGGLMVSLTIYNKLLEEDITKGYQIAGTGTIDGNGNVGSIGGVKYKLKGAVDQKMDVFLVPNGENYEECIALQKKYHYPIKIIGVSTFQDALQALNQL